MFTASPVSGSDLAGTAPRLAPRLASHDRRDDLLRQSRVALSLGSPFVSEVLAAAYRQLARAPRLEAVIAAWPFDPATSAMALRLNAGLHALARRGTFTDLAALYARQHNAFDRAVGEALQEGETTLLTWMGHPTQTNEVRRSSAFMAALVTLAHEHGLPFELLEIGASAGLNLLLDRYAHDLGGMSCGTPDSSLHIVPRWQGPVPPRADVRVISARGVDLRPLRVDDPETRERLMSYIWPGDKVRSGYLRRALILARDLVPNVAQASAAPWLAERLKEPQAERTMRIVQHSMVLQYLPEDEREAVIASIRAAGGRATPERPLARIGLEWNADRSEVLLSLTRWSGRADDGHEHVLAACHPYGAVIEWRGLPDACPPA
ncbi:hypothetical protein SAMN05518801_103182 [Novosphingobium sp. CF614]|uniref:DUF2332 domain-containing protein n=1 Tax=Novosphingobium sp. CF614 TaxID=1884364 RepID=UPI0008EA5595|nr:DUF2332 family protein [Novosphingobium sp. CF614]SFF91943.1 hypothetical protein SAMN05518801_103182 [Novosphingobium sp. CF614]